MDGTNLLLLAQKWREESYRPLTTHDLAEFIFALEADGDGPIFTVGQNVRHRSMGAGIVREVDEKGTVTVDFKDGAVRGVYDRDWFRINPTTLFPANS